MKKVEGLRSFSGIREGDYLECIDSQGWSDFGVGGIYRVTGVWTDGIDLDDSPVSEMFSLDFSLFERG